MQEDSTSSLQIGRFSLSTKNFWLVLVCILCMFLLAVIWTNIYSYNKIVTKFF